MRINSDDLKLIEQLEMETGITLKRVPMEAIGNWQVSGFAADDNGRVLGLEIFNKKLRRLPELLSKFQGLKKLAIIRTQISDISSLNELKGLTHLNLGVNQIRDISSLNQLKGLKELYLFNNQISDISSLKELKGLTELSLSDNQISDISSLNELKGLTDLNLNTNQITDISSLNELKELTILSLASNQISDISSLKELKNLKVLYLQGNKITHMPAEFLDLGLEIKWEWEGKATGIFVAENPLESPPVEIIEQGMDAIRQYFKSLEED